ncbi:hypothetical protein [Chitinophaga tropicalis]|uniref:Uncharacterized protein n=1 Tax=Chitinophaga tropicalis TaxID=2683588 RepID=A0A7K1U0C8_9BACT|nr:hypothetical protein [Chitinophaga tropicalis]MVT07750.1 hypothetical protein [Chitinophaga tropicalis]
MTQQRIVEKLTEIQFLLFSIARLQAINTFGVGSFEAKLKYSSNAYTAIYKANLVATCLQYTYNQKARACAWDVGSVDIERLIDLEGANIELSESYIRKYQEQLAYVVAALRTAEPENKLMYLPGLFLVDQLAIETGSISAVGHCIEVRMPREAVIIKTATGPRHELLDEIYEPTYSAQERKPLTFGDNIDHNIEYFWILATQELLAADLCSLSVIEYDNLPFDFYYDFITQSWDETRHACHYLQLTKKLLPEVYAKTNNSRLKGILEKYFETGTLPIPKEKNFYEAMQNATLQERMILLNIRTEAPAVRYLTKRMESVFFKEYPDIRESFQYDKNDEIRHGHVGAKWLKYLYPDIQERKNAMANADNLRGFLMATALSMYSEKEYVAFLSDFK